VRVVERATLTDVGQLLQTHSVVSLLAHGPYHMLRKEDVRNFDGFQSILREARENRLLDLHPVVSRLVSLPEVRNARNPEMLLRALNPLLEKARQFFHAQHTSDEITRAHLWDAFPDAFAPPTIVELSDGFHALDEVVNAIPTQFQGTMHFLTCSALWFSESFRRAHPRIGDIPCPRGLADIVTNMRIYRSTIEQISLRPSPFSHALFLIHETLLVLLNEQASEGVANA
jgi:hypothetical protein